MSVNGKYLTNELCFPQRFYESFSNGLKYALTWYMIYDFLY